MIESEQAVIGAALYSPSDCTEAFERLRPEHFEEATHGAIWELVRAGTATDPVLVYQKLSGHPGLETLGGVGYLALLVDRATLHTLPQHVSAILDSSTRRSIDQLSRYVQDETRKPGRGEALLGEIESACATIAREGAEAPSGVPLGLTTLDNIDAALRGDFRGAETGLRCIDRVTGGIKRDDVWFIGGRTSMGKSVAGLCLANGIAQQARGVLMFSLEMPLREVQMRAVADIAHDPNLEPIRYGDLLNGRLNHHTRDRARDAAKKLASLPITVNDRGGLTIDDIRHQALRQVRAWEKARIAPGLVLIDHIGLVKPVRKTDNKASDTSDIVNELKGIAKQIGCPILALAQINRSTESRQDKRPTIADFNWSGAMEQIADFVCLLYRQGYYDARSSDPSDQMRVVETQYDLELIVAKNRSGPICTVKAWADVSQNAIRDLADPIPARAYR